jgi:hypothetical protein
LLCECAQLVLRDQDLRMVFTCYKIVKNKEIIFERAIRLSLSSFCRNPRESGDPVVAM